MLRPKNVIDADDPHVSRIGLPAPPWLISYADLMTELTILFIVLYALSSALNKDLQKTHKDVKEVMEKEQVAGKVEMEKDGLRISLEEGHKTALFESGSAVLSAHLREVLAKMRPSLERVTREQEIIVEGHTDNVPIRKPFESNWELSTARATNVVRFLVKDLGLPPTQLAAIGYGENRPVAPNDSVENRAKNRRVVLFVKTDKKKAPPKAGETISQAPPKAEAAPPPAPAPQPEPAPQAPAQPAPAAPATEGLPGLSP